VIVIGVMMKKIAFPILLAATLSCLTTGPSANTGSGSGFFDKNSTELQALFPANLPSKEGLQIYLRESEYEYLPDGSLQLSSRWIYKILSNESLEGWSNVQVEWSPWNMSRPDIQARVTNPDGQQHWLNPNHIVEGAPQQGENGILTSNKVLTAPFPQIRVGSIVEEEVRFHYKPYVQDAGIRKAFRFSLSLPIKNLRLSVTVPEGMPFHYEVHRMKSDPEIVERNGQRTYVFDKADHPGHDGYERMVDKHASSYPYVEFSNAHSWSSLAQKYAQEVEPLMAPLGEPYPDLDWTDFDEALPQILHWLDQEVRYVGLELGQNSIIPFSPAQSLARGFGDCKDKATILISILREQGIPAHIALLRISDNQDVDPEVPGLEKFDHAIVYIDSDPPIWIDPTTDLNRTAALPPWDRNRNALIIRDGQNSLVRTTPDSPEENQFTEIRRFLLSPNGYAKLEASFSGLGMYEIFMRQNLHEDPEEYTGNLVNYLAKVNNFAELGQKSFTNPRDYSEPASINFTLQHVESGSTDLHESLVVLENWTTAKEIPNLFFQFDTETRALPYEAPRAKEVRMIYQIVPPKGFVLTEPIPVDLIWETEPFSFNRTLTQTPEGEVHVEYYTRINDGVYSPKVFMETIDYLKTRTQNFPEKEVLRFQHKYQELAAQNKHIEAFALLKEYSLDPDVHTSDYHRLTHALMEMGMRDEAAKAALKAIEMDPDSLVNNRVMGSIFQYDILGREFHPSSDWEQALFYLKKAEEIEPRDPFTLSRLSLHYQYGPEMIRFNNPSNLPLALEYQRRLIEVQSSDENYNDLFYILAHLDRWEEIRNTVPQLENALLKGIFSFLSVSAIEGGEKGFEELQNLSQEDFGKALELSLAFYIDTGDYAIATEILTLLSQGSSNRMALEEQADFLKRYKTHSGRSAV
jgi:tetratricopeptide (TPR) repeat protein